MGPLDTIFMMVPPTCRMKTICGHTLIQECWQKGMVLRDTDWLCYELNKRGPCGPNQRIVYRNRLELQKAI